MRTVPLGPPATVSAGGCVSTVHVCVRLLQLPSASDATTSSECEPSATVPVHAPAQGTGRPPSGAQVNVAPNLLGELAIYRFKRRKGRPLGSRRAPRES